MASSSSSKTAETNEVSRVLITGVSGYIGAHVARACLDAGFRVRGTTRSLKNAEKVEALRNIAPGAAHSIELVEIDLLDANAWTEAVKGCSHILHVASPLDRHMKEAEIVNVAVTGTKNVLAAAAATNGGVKRVVVTSSAVAIAYGHKKEAGYKFSEKDWTIPDKETPYVKSKYFAERAAWAFVQDLSSEQRFELATVNPMFVLGPLAVEFKQAGTSVTFVKDILSGKVPMVPDIRMGIVDVRDVAHAHVLAMTKPEAAGQRYLCSSVSSGVRPLVGILHNEFAPQGYKIPTTRLGYKMFWCISRFDKTLRPALQEIGKDKLYDTSKAQALGVTFRPIKETLIDMSYNLIALGIVADKSKDGSMKAKALQHGSRGAANTASTTTGGGAGGAGGAGAGAGTGARTRAAAAVV